MKNQALFSSNDISKKLKCCLLQFLFGTLGLKLDHTAIQDLNYEPTVYQAVSLLSFVFHTNKLHRRICS